jgi:uncharacterized linocin/CFP29 family protein
MEIATVSQPSELFGSNAGRWATERMLKAMAEGRELSAQELRTADTLRHEEWKYFDKALVQAALIRLVGVADLINLGLTLPVPNALGKMVVGYEKSTFMDEASVSLDGLIARTDNDRQEFVLSQLPLPIIHKDFFLNLRTLAASRNGSTPLDVTQVSTAGRVVAEKAEKLLFQGGPQFGGLTMPGLNNHPDKNTYNFTSDKSWDDVTKAGADFLTDVIGAITALQADRMYGPYGIYVPGDAAVNLENDFKAFGTQTIRQRLEAIDNISFIHVADQLPTQRVIVVQLTEDVVKWVQGETLQTVQWDAAGGFKINFKAFMIGAPLVRSDYANRCGVCVIKKAAAS